MFSIDFPFVVMFVLLLSPSSYPHPPTAGPQEKLDSLWHAAKHYEVCGELCKGKADWERVAVFFRRAADAYRTGGKATVGECRDLDLYLEDPR